MDGKVLVKHDLPIDELGLFIELNLKKANIYYMGYIMSV